MNKKLLRSLGLVIGCAIWMISAEVKAAPTMYVENNCGLPWEALLVINSKQKDIFALGLTVSASGTVGIVTIPESYGNAKYTVIVSPMWCQNKCNKKKPNDTDCFDKCQNKIESSDGVKYTMGGIIPVVCRDKNERTQVH